MAESSVTVIGGGLSGSEAAWQLAERGLFVDLYEQKPVAMSPAHKLTVCCELVCSNSLRSDDPSTPAGLLKEELRRMRSLVIGCADRHRVPAGSALAVDRDAFGHEVTTLLALHPRIRIHNEVVDALPDGPVIVATGPLTGGRLAEALREASGQGPDSLYFYDAIAPIVAADTIDPERSFCQSRWDKSDEAGGEGAQGEGPGSFPTLGEGSPAGDYINCPLTEAEYAAVVAEILAARKIDPQPFEEPRYFEGCLPIEVMAGRGHDVLRFGPMRPVGLTDPRTGRRPFAVVQLRPENRYLSAYNLVGFQTRMAYPEQKRIFAMIPALAEAEFLRFGSIHRNTYLDAPRVIGEALELLARPAVHIGGLLTGVEGYIESCAMGFLAALFCEARLAGRELSPPPPETAFGGLYHHVSRHRGPGEAYGPTNINFGLLPRLEARAPKRDRKRMVAERARAALGPWLRAAGIAEDAAPVQAMAAKLRATP